jgi:hypothetical protein
VQLKCHSIWLALLALLSVIGAGCSGINASHSVSPATFLLPGLGRVEPANPSQDTSDSIIKSDQIQASVPIVAQAQ